MPFSNSSLSAQVKSYLTFLPEEIRQKILEHLHGVIHYEPVIGIMGKSGTARAACVMPFFSPVSAPRIPERLHPPGSSSYPAAR